MRNILLVILVASSGCTSPTRETSTTQSVSVQPADPDAQEPQPTQKHSANNALAGSYYRGDGTGFNLNLALQSDGTFTCNWTGCLGAYGASSGKWAVEGDQIITETVTEEGMMEGKPIGNLTIVNDETQLVLVQNSNRDFYDEHGASRFSCFTPASRN